MTKITPDDIIRCAQLLASHGIAHEIRDSTLTVPGSIFLAGMHLQELPDFSAAHVMGDFRCERNELVSLKGAPRRVDGTLACYQNRLTSLEGVSSFVGMHLWCDNNRLVTLRGTPENIGGNLYCKNNPSLTSLDYAPKHFVQLHSDFGTFSSWHDIPKDLLLSPERRQWLQQGAALKQPVKLLRRIGGPK